MAFITGAMIIAGASAATGAYGAYQSGQAAKAANGQAQTAMAGQQGYSALDHTLKMDQLNMDRALQFGQGAPGNPYASLVSPEFAKVGGYVGLQQNDALRREQVAAEQARLFGTYARQREIIGSKQLDNQQNAELGVGAYLNSAQHGLNPADRAGEAAATTGAAFDNTDRQRIRNMQSMGLDPSSGRSASSDRYAKLAKAAEMAKASNQAYEATTQEQYRRRADVANFARGMGTNASASVSSTGTMANVGAAPSMANQINTMGSLANTYSQQAANAANGVSSGVNLALRGVEGMVNAYGKRNAPVSPVQQAGAVPTGVQPPPVLVGA